MLSEYQVLDAGGRRLDPARFHLQRNYWGLLHTDPSGLKPPPTLDVFGEVPDLESLTRHVRRELAGYPGLDRVTVILSAQTGERQQKKRNE